MSETLTDADRDTIHRIAAERYATQLLWALQDAVAGASHWRPRAQDLLRKVDLGDLPEPRR
jgi:hypothetical protein